MRGAALQPSGQFTAGEIVAGRYPPAKMFQSHRQNPHKTDFEINRNPSSFLESFLIFLRVSLCRAIHVARLVFLAILGTCRELARIGRFLHQVSDAGVCRLQSNV